MYGNKASAPRRRSDLLRVSSASSSSSLNRLPHLILPLVQLVCHCGAEAARSWSPRARRSPRGVSVHCRWHATLHGVCSVLRRHAALLATRRPAVQRRSGTGTLSEPVAGSSAAMFSSSAGPGAEGRPDRRRANLVPVVDRRLDGRVASSKPRPPSNGPSARPGRGSANEDAPRTARFNSLTLSLTPSRYSRHT